MRPSPTIACCFLCFILITGCNPVLDDIQPVKVFPRQIVAVQGSNLQGAKVLWDGGGQVLQSLGEPRYFQIPPNASPGVHDVRLRNSYGQSAKIVQLEVAPLSGVWPRPRIQDVSTNSVTMNTDGSVNMKLAVSAANVDPNAIVLVNGEARSSVFYSAIPADYFISHDAATFAYPVYHYGQLLVHVENQEIRRDLAVVVKNQLDGGTSDAWYYTLPSSAAEWDSDGDGLLDTWETNGYQAPGGTRINLQAMGCHPLRKDILVEVDWIPAAVPMPTIWDKITRVFKDSPVLNPDGTRGIALHIDRGQGGLFTGGGEIAADHETIDFCDNADSRHAVFSEYKAMFFAPERTEIFHYGIFGRSLPEGNVGRGEIWGNDFMVAFSGSQWWESEEAQVGVFIHELGHNLALRHGGTDIEAPDVNELFKPNQESSMNYRYTIHGVSFGHDMIPGGWHSYSQGMYRTINEPEVDESAGISCTKPIDFDRDGQMTSNRAVNANRSPQWYGEYDRDATDKHVNYDEWGSLRLNFRQKGSRWEQDRMPCTADPFRSCGTVRWRVAYERATSCTTLTLRLFGLGSTADDGGPCAPPLDCGLLMPCVNAGNYFAAVEVCDTTIRHYYVKATPIVPAPNGPRDTVRVLPGGITYIYIVVPDTIH